ASHPFPTRVQLVLPLGELRREPDVLAVASNGQRKLVFVHNRLDRLRGRIAENAGHARRRKRELGKALRIGRPWDDVDSFATELVDDRLNPRALEADASSNRINGIVARKSRDLGAPPDLAGAGADLDQVLLDLRDLQLEQRLHEQRIS